MPRYQESNNTGKSYRRITKLVIVFDGDDVGHYRFHEEKVVVDDAGVVQRIQDLGAFTVNNPNGTNKFNDWDKVNDVKLGTKTLFTKFNTDAWSLYRDSAKNRDDAV